MAQQTPPPLQRAPQRSGLEPAMARRLLVGLLLVVVMVASVGGWAATTPIGGAVIASGFVVVESNIKKVQHPTAASSPRSPSRMATLSTPVIVLVSSGRYASSRQPGDRRFAAGAVERTQGAAGGRTRSNRSGQVPLPAL